MASLNQVMIIGNLGRDPEVRQAGDSPVYVEGKLQTRKWQDRDGKDRYTTEVVADTFQMLGGRRDDGSSQQGGYDRRGSDYQSGSSYGSSAPAPSAPMGSAPDEDLPF